MVKRIILLRHAKSDWSDPFLSDHDRPLNKRGRNTASKLGRYCLQENIQPDLVLCSTATRTRETYARLQKKAGFQAPVHYERQLYGAGVQAVLNLLHAQSAEHECILVVGHNPCIEDTAEALTGTDESNLLPLLKEKVPTGTLIALDFDVKDFTHISLKQASLKLFIRPKFELIAEINSKSTKL